MKRLLTLLILILLINGCNSARETISGDKVAIFQEVSSEKEALVEEYARLAGKKELNKDRLNEIDKKLRSINKLLRELRKYPDVQKYSLQLFKEEYGDTATAAPTWEARERALNQDDEEDTEFTNSEEDKDISEEEFSNEEAENNEEANAEDEEEFNLETGLREEDFEIKEEVNEEKEEKNFSDETFWQPI